VRERDVYQRFWAIVQTEYEAVEPRAIRARITGKYLANAGEVLAAAAVAEYLRSAP
jgi:hypothetical protein